MMAFEAFTFTSPSHHMIVGFPTHSSSDNPADNAPEMFGRQVCIQRYVNTVLPSILRVLYADGRDVEHAHYLFLYFVGTFGEVDTIAQWFAHYGLTIGAVGADKTQHYRVTISVLPKGFHHRYNWSGVQFLFACSIIGSWSSPTGTVARNAVISGSLTDGMSLSDLETSV